MGINKTMKKLIILSLIAIFAILTLTMDANAAKKSSKKLDAAAQDEISETIDNITKKVYSHTLLSPTDNQNMIEVKIKLDNQMLVSSDLSLAPLYYKAGNLYKMRGMNQEAVDCFQTILENFADTALAPKARTQLRSMGIKIAEPIKNATAEDEEE